MSANQEQEIATEGSASASEGPVLEQTTVESKTEQQDVKVKVKSRGIAMGRVALAAAVVLAVALIAFFIYKLLGILLVLFMSLLIATAIEPVVNWLRRGPFNRSAGILIVYSGLFLILGGIGYIMVSVFLSQLGDFRTGLANSVGEMRASVATMDNEFLQQQANTVLTMAEGFVGEGDTIPLTPDEQEQAEEEQRQNVTNTAVLIGEIFFAVITIFVVAFYWLTERTLLKRGLMSWLPTKRANRVRRVWDEIEVKVGGWVRGQLTLMGIVGAASAVGYFVLGLQFWPALALFIAIAEAIPLVGPYIGTAPAVLVALTQRENDGLPALLGMDTINPIVRALLVVLFAVVLQTVEGNVLIPRIMKNSVGISPLTVIISILVGATLAGLAGALVAVPVAGALQVIVSDIKQAHDAEREEEEAAAKAEPERPPESELVIATS